MTKSAVTVATIKSFKKIKVDMKKSFRFNIEDNLVCMKFLNGILNRTDTSSGRIVSKYFIIYF